MRKTDFLLGVLLAVVGLMMIIEPSRCIRVAVIALGAATVVDGVYSIAKIRTLLSDRAFQVTAVISGAVSILVGAVAIILPLAVADVMWTIMLYVLAAYLVLLAVVEMYTVAKLRDTGIARRQYVVDIIVAFICAIILFIIPHRIGLTLVRVLGVIMMIVSAVYLLYQWKNRPIVVEKVEVVDDNTAPVDKPSDSGKDTKSK